VQSVYDRRRAPLVVVSEGFKLEGMDEEYSRKGVDASNRPRLGGIGELIAPMIEERTGIESRSTVLGHIQRGGAPSGADRVLATRFGLAAIDAIIAEAWGSMVSLRGTEIIRVPMSDALGELKRVPDHRYREAEMLFG
jgi:6-phosphofructokinase 1